MRSRRLVALPLLLAAALPGCSGFTIGVRQDKEDKAAFTAALGRARGGDRFPARALLAKRWTRLWLFRGGVATQAIEDRIGVPFPQSGDPTPAGAYLVWVDGDEVLSAFSYAGPGDVDPACLLAEGGPLRPQTALSLVGEGAGRPLGTSRLSTVAGARRCR